MVRFALVLLLLSVGSVALAQPGGGGPGPGGGGPGGGGPGPGGGGPGGGGPGGGGPGPSGGGGQHSVPEMNPSSMGSALGLIGAGTVLLLGRRRKMA